MIEFFEFMNTCSALRTTAYLLFIIAITFIVFAGIIDIIGKLRGAKTTHLVRTDETDNEEDDE